MEFKEIHIGNLIKLKVDEQKIDPDRICNFFHTDIETINQIYLSSTIQTEILLRWSKLLKYDFFRLYSHHLILYSPPSGIDGSIKKQKSLLPQFKKNLYTKEIIDYILEVIISGEKTKQQVIEEYRIPKTTLYKWISKYKK